ncbi:MAG: peptidoglycan DD-metalloendopeptidase family protein [Odoribacter sp.]
MILKEFLIVLFCLLVFQTGTWGQSINNIKKEKERSEKEISYLNKLLEETKNDKSASTAKLNILQQKIVQSKRVLLSLSKEVKYFQVCISVNEQRIYELESERNSMLQLYAKLVYGSWKKRNKSNKLMFIFSSADFNQAYNRFKYFQQIQEYSGRQLQLIQQVNDSLSLKTKELRELVDQKNTTLGVINYKNKELESEKSKENQYITDIQKKERTIKKKLEREIKNRQKLSKELDRLIALQTKKSGSSSSTYRLTPEEKLVSDNFASNRGKLPWPVAEGFISERFGVNVHPVLKYVKTSNNGVNITTSKNADIRSVFQGVVSEIFFVPDLNNVVVVRHGSYLTVYSNLIDVTVKKGAQVKTKDVIGRVAYDDEKGNVLHFEVWKDIEKLNPEFWLAK